MASIHLGIITIPHFPVEARFEAETVLSKTNYLQVVLSNLWTAIKLLTIQPNDIVDRYGYFYKITFPFALIGIVLLVIGLKSENI